MKLHEALRSLEACHLPFAKAHATRGHIRRSPVGFDPTTHSNVKYNGADGAKQLILFVGNVIDKKDILSRPHHFHNLLDLTPSSPVWPVIRFGLVRIRSDSVSRRNISVPQAYQH